MLIQTRPHGQTVVVTVVDSSTLSYKNPTAFLEGRQVHNLSNGFPAVPPVRPGFQCGPFPAASGSFAWNDHNGGVLVADLGVDGFSTRQAPQEFLLRDVCFTAG